MEKFASVSRPRFTLITPGLNTRRGFFYPYEDLRPSFQRYADSVGIWQHGNRMGSCFVVSSGNNQFVITATHCLSDDREVKKAYITLPSTGESIVLSPFSRIPLPRWMRELDIAVARIDPFTKTTGLKLPTRSSIDCDQLMGQVVMASGFPYLYDQINGCQNPLTSVGKILRVDWSAFTILTNVRLEPGSSGSPLLNDRGEVVGIASSVKSQAKQNTNITKEGRDFLSLIDQTLPKRHTVSNAVNIYPVLEVIG